MNKKRIIESQNALIKTQAEQIDVLLQEHEKHKKNSSNSSDHPSGDG